VISITIASTLLASDSHCVRVHTQSHITTISHPHSVTFHGAGSCCSLPSGGPRGNGVVARTDRALLSACAGAPPRCRASLSSQIASVSWLDHAAIGDDANLADVENRRPPLIHDGDTFVRRQCCVPHSQAMGRPRRRHWPPPPFVLIKCRWSFYGPWRPSSSPPLSLRSKRGGGRKGPLRSVNRSLRVRTFLFHHFLWCSAATKLGWILAAARRQSSPTRPAR